MDAIPCRTRRGQRIHSRSVKHETGPRASRHVSSHDGLVLRHELLTTLLIHAPFSRAPGSGRVTDIPRARPPPGQRRLRNEEGQATSHILGGCPRAPHTPSTADANTRGRVGRREPKGNALGGGGGDSESNQCHKRYGVIGDEEIDLPTERRLASPPRAWQPSTSVARVRGPAHYSGRPMKGSELRFTFRL